MHDLHATLLHVLGLDHERLTYRHASRDFRLTDVYGRVVHTSWLERVGRLSAARRAARTRHESESSSTLMTDVIVFQLRVVTATPNSRSIVPR